jgi:arabinosaccharide transport system permease protein
MTLAPFAFMLVSSFKPGEELLRNGINANLQFDVMSLKNYVTLFTGKDMIYLSWFKNSLIITILFTIISVFLSSLVGYGLAVYEFKGKKIIFITVLVVMMIPVEILLLPLYKLMITLHLIDTYLGVILPFAVSPFAIFFFHQFAAGLPKEFIEAARIDGCSEFGIFFKIIIPLMKPAFGAMIILQGMQSWNSFVWPLIVLRSTENLTLPIGLASLITPYGNNYDMLMPGAVMSIIPIALLFLFNQKSFISVIGGGIKG